MRRSTVVAKKVEPIKLEIKQHNNFPAYELPYGAFCYDNPTHNCQVFSVGSFDCLLNTLKDEQITKLIHELAEDHIDKYIMLIDVSSYHEKRVDELYKYSVITKTPYVSTNDSDMILYLIKIRENEEDEYNDDYDDDDDY